MVNRASCSCRGPVSVPGIHIRQFTSACESSSRAIVFLHGQVHSCVRVHMYTHSLTLTNMHLKIARKIALKTFALLTFSIITWAVGETVSIALLPQDCHKPSICEELQSVQGAVH